MILTASNGKHAWLFFYGKISLLVLDWVYCGVLLISWHTMMQTTEGKKNLRQRKEKRIPALKEPKNLTCLVEITDNKLQLGIYLASYYLNHALKYIILTGWFENLLFMGSVLSLDVDNSFRRSIFRLLDGSDVCCGSRCCSYGAFRVCLLACNVINF